MANIKVFKLLESRSQVSLQVCKARPYSVLTLQVSLVGELLMLAALVLMGSKAGNMSVQMPQVNTILMPRPVQHLSIAICCRPAAIAHAYVDISKGAGKTFVSLPCLQKRFHTVPRSNHAVPPNLHSLHFHPPFWLWVTRESLTTN